MNEKDWSQLSRGRIVLDYQDGWIGHAFDKRGQHIVSTCIQVDQDDALAVLLDKLWPHYQELQKQKIVSFRTESVRVLDVQEGTDFADVVKACREIEDNSPEAIKDVLDRMRAMNKKAVDDGQADHL